MKTTSSEDPHDPDMIRDGSALMAFLHIMKKAHVHLLRSHSKAEQEARDRFDQVKTRTHAKLYMEEIMPKLLAERDSRRQTRLGRK